MRDVGSIGGLSQNMGQICGCDVRECLASSSWKLGVTCSQRLLELQGDAGLLFLHTYSPGFMAPDFGTQCLGCFHLR